jgi:predicted nucleotidyltransferase
MKRSARQPPSKSRARPPAARRRAHNSSTRRAKATDALSATLASGAFATLVRYFTVGPDKTPHLRALMRETGLGARSIQVELARMKQIGLVHEERTADGRRVTIRAVQTHPAWAPLRTLVRMYALPEDVLKMTIAGLPHIAAAFIFGSVARGTARPESDCDVMVVLADAATLEERRSVETALAVQIGETSLALGREVSVIVYTAEEMRARFLAGQGFMAAVVSGPKRWVSGTALALERLLWAPAGAVA